MAEGPEGSAANSNLRAKQIGKQVGLGGSAAALWADWRTLGNHEGLVIAGVARKFSLETNVFGEVVVKRPTTSVQTVGVRIVVSRIKASIGVKQSYFRFRVILGRRCQPREDNQ